MNRPHANAQMQWVPCLLLDDQHDVAGVPTGTAEYLPGTFFTAEEAMTAAKVEARKRPDAIGIGAMRVGGPHAA